MPSSPIRVSRASPPNGERHMRSVWIGYDPREAEAFAVCRYSIARHTIGLPIHALCLDELRDAGLYWRPTSKRDGKLWDDISDAGMSTEFACSRFLTPLLARTGWALFMDSDIVVRTELHELFMPAYPFKAVMCVPYVHVPTETVKKDHEIQTKYHRKNWSSVALWNCDHPSNRVLTLEMINGIPGRDLHSFGWLKDEEIGSLPIEWNWLVTPGQQHPLVSPKMVHFTNGGPWLPEYRDLPYAKL